MKEHVTINDGDGTYGPWREETCTGFMMAFSSQRGRNPNDQPKISRPDIACSPLTEMAYRSPD